MTEAEYQAFLEPSIREYAEDHVKDGEWSEEEALEKSRKEFYDLLPQGLETPNHYLFTIVNEEQQNVGMIWFMLRKRQGKLAAFIYDVKVDEPFRRRGYASQAFRELEHKVRELGGSKIALHVFGHNHGAIQLYTKLGYVVTNLHMAKEI
jgi:ribosomal protein S18 acetylase RimI-like enzyme